MLRRARVTTSFCMLTTCCVFALLGAPTAYAWVETEQQVQQRLSQPDFARGGYYFGFEGLVALDNSPALPNEAFSGGFHGRLGHRHNRWVANEIMGLYVHTFDAGQALPTQNAAIVSEFLAWGLYFNTRLYPLKTRFQPFVGFGPGLVQLRPDQSYVLFPRANPTPEKPVNGLPVFPKSPIGFSMIFSAGVEAYVSEGFAVTIQGNYHLNVGNLENQDFITAGLGVQFF